MPWILLVYNLFVPVPAHAYPEFIGYKYSSCVTCHYNGHGNGPINDYGRALWASEIAGRMFAGKRNEEQLAEASGFVGSKPLPWWLRPGIKARGLQVKPSPGGDGKDRYILMQAEANVAVMFDRDQRFIFVGAYGHAPIPQRLSGQPGEGEIDQWISREHYVRWQKSDSLWLYLGKMDKVYGLRIVNHTAYSRARTGLAQNDQSHGVIAHYIKPEWEFTLNGFVGDLAQDADLRQTGASTMYEYEVAEAWRLGASALFSTNKYIGNQRFGVHSKSGFGHGSSLLFEVGLIRNIPESADATLGYYVFSEIMQKVVRGYHAFASAQMFKDRMEGTKPDYFKTSFGMLAFPMQRLEFRIEAENTQQLSSSAQTNRDIWAALLQAHVSL